VPLPRDGIAFQGGRLNLASPYLSLETGFDGYYKSLSDTQIILDVEHSDLNYDSSQLSLWRKPQNLTLIFIFRN